MRRRMRRAMLALALVTFTLGAAPSAHAYVLAGKPWPGHTIRYYETLPPAFDPIIARAVEAWNTSGAHMRFVKVKPAAAQLHIGRGFTGGSLGFASIGREPGAYVHIAIRHPGRNELERYLSSAILAHELGHVLGLDHTGLFGCKTMSAILRTDACPQAEEPWRFYCRLLDADAIAGAVHRYGGKAHRLAPAFCDHEPQPPELLDLQFDGGDEAGSAVRISWRRPAGLRDDSQIDIGVYRPGACGDRNERVEHYTLAPNVTSWTDEHGEERPPRLSLWCYRIQVISKFGRTTHEQTRELTSYLTPPTTPVVGPLTENPPSVDYADYFVDVQLPDPKSFLVATYGPSGQCRSTWPGGSDFLSVDMPSVPGPYAISRLPAGAWCISFFARKETKLSAPVTVEVVHVKRPAGT